MQNYGTILIIDDNEAILTALKYCLAGTFEKVRTLTAPDSVLSLLEQEQVDIILLDMNFTLGVNSGQDGLVWLQAIRKHLLLVSNPLRNDGKVHEHDDERKRRTEHDWNR